MADEVASATLSTGQKAVEVTLELIKLLAPLVKSLLEEVYHKSVDGVNFVGGKIANAKAVGTVSNKGLIVEAQKANSPINSTSNFLARDAERVAAKAKEYKIPIAVVGKGEKQTIEFLARDKGVMEQILNEVMQERIQGAPQSVRCFSLGENNVAAMKSLFEENGIECQFVGGKDGKISCIYPAECAEQVAVIKADYKQMYSEIAENFSITTNVPETERQIEITARIDELQNAERGSEIRAEAYDRILSDMRENGVEFPEYSENNQQIIERDFPEATQVAGKAFWESQGYKLNEDAKGIEIIAPEMDEAGNPVLDENGKQTFTTVTVYDISETNAYEAAIAPEISELQSEYAAEKANALKASDKIEVTIEDAESGIRNRVTIDDLRDKGLTQENMSLAFQRHFGYPPAKADIAANKFAYELGLDKQHYFARQTQIDNLDALKTNIRYQSDDITLRDVRFDAVCFKDGEDTHIILRNGENAVGLTPARMTDAEMKDLCVNQLGLSESQAEKAVAKANKIESQVRSQVAERAVDEQGISREAHIERTSAEHFTVQLGDKKKSYNFNIPKTAERVAADFGIPRESAQSIVNKAQKQSVIQNRINAVMKKKKNAPAPTPETPKISTGKGLKRK